MRNELLWYARGELAVPRHDRPVAQRTKQFYDDMRERAFYAGGVMALGAYIAEQEVDFILRLRELAGDDPELMMVTDRRKARTMRQVDCAQDGTCDRWGF